MQTVYDTNSLPLHILKPVDLHSSNIRRPKLFGTFRSSDNLSEHENSVHECVEQLSILLADIV
jgi:hypothetical protein